YGKRRTADALRRSGARRTGATSAGIAGAGGTGPPHGAPAVGAFRRRAATRVAGTGVGESSFATAGRRADRKSRQPHGRGHSQSDSRSQLIARHDGGDGDARAGAGGAIRAEAGFSG